MMSSGKGDRAVKMSHTGFPPLLIILSLKFLLNLERGPETIQTLIHLQVNTLLIMVYAHCMDRQAMNATSYLAATIVVCHYTCILHLSSFREHDLIKKKANRKKKLKEKEPAQLLLISSW